jgi:hypothetical protein
MNRKLTSALKYLDWSTVETLIEIQNFYMERLSKFRIYDEIIWEQLIMSAS